MLTKDQILDILRAEMPVAQERFKVRRLGLFGSYVRGEQTTASDIDLHVEFSAPAGYFTLIALEDYLTERLGVKVDLGTTGSLKPIIRDRVLEETIYV